MATAKRGDRPPPPTIVVPHTPADPNALARLIEDAEPGTRFEIGADVQATIVVRRDVTITAAPGVGSQSAHLVGTEARPAIVVRGGTLTLRGLTISAPQGDGVVVEGGAVVADDCLFNTPEGAPLVLPPGTRAALSECFVGGSALRVEGGSLTLAHTRFGHCGAEHGLDVSGGDLSVVAGSFFGSTARVRGAGTTASFHGCVFEAGVRDGLRVQDGASVSLSSCRFLEGFLGLRVEHASVRADDLAFADAHGAFPQLRGALRLLDGAEVTLTRSTIRGAASVVGGTTPDGLLEARPWFDEPAQTDALPKVAIAVVGGSRLACEDVRIHQRDFAAVLLRDTSEATFVGGAIVAGDVALALEDVARCTLRKTRLTGTAPPNVAPAATLTLLGTKTTRQRPQATPPRAAVPRKAMARSTLIVDASGAGDVRTLGEALGFGKKLPTITVRAGRYRESLRVRQALTIVADGEVVWEAEMNEPCLTVEKARVEIRGVLFRGKGTADDTLAVTGGTLALTACEVKAGRCALRLDDGKVEATGCTFRESAVAGVIAAEGSLALTDCTIASIAGKPGHGLQATEDADITLVGCAFRDLAGHAIYATQGRPRVTARAIEVSGIGRSAVCALGASCVRVDELSGPETGEARFRVGEEGALLLNGAPFASG